MEETIHIYKLTYKERPVRHPRQKPKILEWLCMCLPLQIELNKEGNVNYIFKGEDITMDHDSIKYNLKWGFKRAPPLSFKVPSQLPDYIEIPNTEEIHKIVLRENLEKSERDKFIRMLKNF